MGKLAATDRPPLPSLSHSFTLDFTLRRANRRLLYCMHRLSHYPSSTGTRPLVLPHTSLRQALAEPIATNGTGSAKVWRPCTPAMAAGLTDRGWSLKEVLLYRVPPWPQPQTV